MTEKRNKKSTAEKGRRIFLRWLPGLLLALLTAALVLHFDHLWLTPVLVFVLTTLFILLQPYLDALIFSLQDLRILLSHNRKTEKPPRRELNPFLLFLLPAFFAVVATLLHMLLRGINKFF